MTMTTVEAARAVKAVAKVPAAAQSAVRAKVHGRLTAAGHGAMIPKHWNADGSVKSDVVAKAKASPAGQSFAARMAAARKAK